MKEFINQYLSKKFHKQGEDYNLHENSKHSSQRFGDGATLASKIHKIFKSIGEKVIDSGTYRRLQNKIVDIKHRQKDEPKGYTAYPQLRGFKLNAARSWNSLLPWIPEISINLSDSIVTISLPEDKSWNMSGFPDRLNRIAITFRVIIVSLQKDIRTEHFFTETAFMVPHEPSKIRLVNIPVTLFDDCIVLVLGFAQYYLRETTGTSDFGSNSKSHLIADVMQVFHVQQGVLLCEREPKKLEKSTPPVLKGGAKWE